MSTQIDLEDLPEDIIAKAQRGLGFSDEELAEKAEISLKILIEIKSGTLDEEGILKISKILKLNGKKIISLGKGIGYPQIPELKCFYQVNTAYKSMKVNAYIIWENFTNRAILFDTGTDATVILNFLEKNRLELDAIFITHEHPDHIAALKTLRIETGADVYASFKDVTLDIKPVEERQKFRIGKIAIYPLETPGHTDSGICYKIEGLESNIIICGDTLFAGSIAGIKKKSYLSGLTAIRDQLLSQPDYTILCPGHGPMTTVAHEKKNNPFFA